MEESPTKKATSEELQQDSQAEDSTSWIIKQGEDLNREARALEEHGIVEQALDVYRQDMTLILQGASELGAEHPLRVSLLRKVATCVAHVEDLWKDLGYQGLAAAGLAAAEGGNLRAPCGTSKGEDAQSDAEITSKVSAAD